MKESTSFSVIIAAILGGAVLFFGLMAYGVIASAFVGAKLWAWFMVPAFGLAPLTMAKAYGISLLTHFWTYNYKSGHKDDRETTQKVCEFVGILIAPWITLFFGWVCHAYFMN